MALRLFQSALCGVVLACAGCVVVPVPGTDTPAAPAAASSAPGQCREFQQTVTIGGRPQQAWGTTCQQADGTWKIASARPDNSAPAGGAGPSSAAYPANSYDRAPYYGPYVVVPVGPPGAGAERK